MSTTFELPGPGRIGAARMTSVKWLSAAALLASGVLFWSDLSTYTVVVKFIVAAGAIAVMLTTVIPCIVSLAWRNSKTVSRSVITAMFALGAIAAAPESGDLSKYRNFQLGTDLATVSAQAGESSSQTKLISSRPALIQELDWSPQPLGLSSQAEAVKTVLFSFYDNHLFQITVEYDRYRTEGMTADDVIEAVSAANGTTATHPAADKAAQNSYSVSEEVVARWEDGQYRVDLIRAPYGPVFRLVATAKGLESAVQSARLESKRLDDQEAPQREAARAADEAQSERARLEKIRLLNKPKFRP
jgi:hypothetical protein